jgi:hypothetical protein
MEWKDYESLLERGYETKDIDYKESRAWNIKDFAKHILAMSNIENGGFIIIGMRETQNGYERTGVLNDHIQTYDSDVMKDQMSVYADPWTNFIVNFHVDMAGNKFVFIRVFEFNEIPVISKKDCTETNKNTIYYRNSNRRPESAPISNTSDLRDLLERAAIKLMKKYHKLGLKISTEEKPDDKTKYIDERQGFK